MSQRVNLAQQDYPRQAGDSATNDSSATTSPVMQDSDAHVEMSIGLTFPVNMTAADLSMLDVRIKMWQIRDHAGNTLIQ